MTQARIEDPEQPEDRIKVAIAGSDDLLIAYFTPEALTALHGALSDYMRQVAMNPGLRCVGTFG